MKFNTYTSIDPIDTRGGRSHHVFWRFIRHNVLISVALVMGLGCAAIVVVFAAWLSRQILRCPSWSIECEVPNHVGYIRDHIGLVQGLTSAVYSIAMAAIAYSAHALSESAVWPLLADKPITPKQFQTYLDASRGSIPSSPMALFAAKSLASGIVLFCTVVVTLTPLSGAPIIGYVYDKQNISVPFLSQCVPGGGIGPGFQQHNPPRSIRASASSLYTSWSAALAEEPLPNYRDWFVDRSSLVQRGNMSVEAVRLKQNITCYAWQPEKPKAKKGHLIFQTNMWRKTGPRRGHSREVSVLRRARLAVWAHDYVFLSPTRTSTMLVFAAPNGTIEGGSTSTDVPGDSKPFVSHISTIACNVDLEFIDDILTIGNYPSHGDRTVPINTLRDIMITQPNSTVDKTIRYDPENNTEDTLNELALWMTVAPITNGVSVEGAQPLYDYKKNELPVHVTTPASGGLNDKWDFSYIENFISVSIGASAIGDSSSWSIGDDHKVNITSHLSQPKLDPSRPLVLIIPPAIILLSAIVLLVCNLRLYRQARLPIMRLATLSEILKSSQTTSLREAAVSEMQRPGAPSGLEQLAIKFESLDNGLWGLEAYNEHQRLLRGQELYSRNPSTITADTLGYEGYSH